MGKRMKLVAAGAVVLRGLPAAPEVLLVHRPEYDDWSLPKGRPFPDEDLPVVAVREVFEETGVPIRLVRRLSTRDYEVKGMPKRAHWYQAVPLADAEPRPDCEETDHVAWVPVERASGQMSYASEKEVLAEALASPAPHHTIVLVRHGKAMLRKHWSGKDWKRPLSARGRRQARRLAPLLAAFGVRRLVASSSTRCVQTLAPTAELLDLPIHTVEALSEEAHKAHPEGTFTATEGLAERAAGSPEEPMAICGHRPVLPTMRDALGLPHESMLVGESLVMHRDEKGRNLQLTVIKSAF